MLVTIAALVVWFMLPPITPPQKGAHAPGGRPAEEHPTVGTAHTRDEANREAAELEDSYAREAAQEYIAPNSPGEVEKG